MLPALVGLLSELKSFGLMAGRPTPINQDPSPDQLAILEVLAQQKDRCLAEQAVLEAYLKLEKKDVAGFNILVTNMKLQGSVEYKDIIVGRSYIRVIRITDKGLLALEIHRSKMRDAQREEVKSILRLLSPQGPFRLPGVAVPGSEGAGKAQ